jgi:hypothetical protein
MKAVNMQRYLKESNTQIRKDSHKHDNLGKNKFQERNKRTNEQKLDKRYK